MKTRYLNEGRFFKQCVVCKKNIGGARGQKFCGEKCRDEWGGRKSALRGLSTGTVGAIQELRVAIHFMKQGFETFRPLSPSCSCDLLLHKKGKIFKIEVRTAYENRDGKIYYPKDRIKARNLILALPERLEFIPKQVRAENE